MSLTDTNLIDSLSSKHCFNTQRNKQTNKRSRLYSSSAHYKRKWLLMPENVCVTWDKHIILKANWMEIELALAMRIIILQAQEFYGRNCAALRYAGLKWQNTYNGKSFTDLKSPDTKPKSTTVHLQIWC